jgi:hypothetical protein
MLRKIASQGVMDEGPYRAIAWRVLLEYVPHKDISNTWKRDLPPQRTSYASFVSDYFLQSTALDPGRELRGNHSKKLQTQRQRQEYEKVQRLDYESESESHDLSAHNNEDSNGSLGEEDIVAAVSSSDSKDSSSSPSSRAAAVLARQTSSASSLFTTTASTTILDQLPPKFKEQWKKSGISIDSTKSTQATNMALGINQLVIPQVLLEYTEDDEINDDNEDNDNEASQEAQSTKDAAAQKAFDQILEHAQLLEEIRKDVVRTHPDLFFFLEPNNNLGLRRYAALERILFVWAKLNKGVSVILCVMMMILLLLEDEDN